MQRAPESLNVVTEEKRESHEWILLTRKLRSIGSAEAAVQLEKALDTFRVQSRHDKHHQL